MSQMKLSRRMFGAYPFAWLNNDVTSIFRMLTIVLCFSMLAACADAREIDDTGLYDEEIDGGSVDFDGDGLYPPGYDPTIPQGTLQDLQENIGDRIFFETDSSVLLTGAVEILENQVSWLKHYGIGVITVEGHADERGTREYNLALSARRANAVRDFMVSRGVSFDAVKTLAYGKERPVSLCSETRCWDQNRRSVTLVE